MKSLIENVNFRLLWMAQIISGVGDVLYTVGVMVTVFQRTGSALQTTGVLVASYLPAFIIGPLAGVVVDRRSRRVVMMICDLLRALLVGILLIAIRDNAFSLWLVYLIVGGLSVAGSFYRPARMAIIPTLVKKENLVQANSILIGTLQGTLAFGYMTGGLLALHLSFEVFVLIDLLTFLVAALLVYFISEQEKNQTPPETEKNYRNLLQSFRGGIRYLKTNPLAKSLVYLEWMEHIPHGIWTSALMLVFVQQALNGEANDWGYQTGTYYGGEFVGAFFAGIIARRLASVPGWVIIGNVLFTAIFTTIYALSPNSAFALIVCFFFGPPNSIRDITEDTLLQSTVDQSMMGRVYALRDTIAGVLFMLSGLLFAWLADHISIRYIYIAGGVLYLLTALFALSSSAIRTSRLPVGGQGKDT